MLPKTQIDWSQDTLRRCLFGAGAAVVVMVIVVAYGQRFWVWLMNFTGLEYRYR